MKSPLNRREFVKTSSAGIVGAGLFHIGSGSFSFSDQETKRVGIIGLDTSHSIAFTKALNDPAAGPELGGFKVVAAYPKGSTEIKSSADRIPGYTKEVIQMGVKIVDSIEELLGTADHILLETNDGRLHFQQALQVMRSGKRMFIDKPVAASLPDVISIFGAAEYYRVPVFSSSSLRYISGIDEIRNGSIGKVLGADVYSPATIEKTHPDLFWYGVHGVETLFTAVGTGCISVVRTFTNNTDVVTGRWQDDRLGTFRGIRSGKSDYGGTVFGEKGISVLGKYNGYNPLLGQIVKFFQTGEPPVSAAETTEIFAFMAAAEESKRRKEKVVEIEEVMQLARKESEKALRNIR